MRHRCVEAATPSFRLTMTGAPTRNSTSAGAAARGANSTNEQQQRKGCSLLPHGAYTLIPATLSTMGWIASLAQDGCDYSRLTGPTVDDLMAGGTVVVVGGIPYLEVGFNAYRAPQYWPQDNEWKVDYSSRCIAYDPDVVTMDIFWKLGKAFEFFSLVLGGGGALFLWFSGCFVFSPATWRWAGHEVCAAATFQSMAFIWFATSMCRQEGNTCSLFFGSKADIAAAAFWLTSALAIYLRYPLPQPKDGDHRQQQEGPSSDTEEGLEMNGGPTGDGGVGGSSPEFQEDEVEDLQFENDEIPRNQVAGSELPLEGNVRAKIISQQGDDSENPEMEIPAHKDDAEII